MAKCFQHPFVDRATEIILFLIFNSLSKVVPVTALVIAAVILSPTSTATDESVILLNDQAKLLETFRREFVAIAPGKDKFPEEFRFGPPNEPTAVKVKLESSFEISKFETYQSVYESVMGQNPSQWKGPRFAVETVTFDQAVEFCEKVTRQMRDAKLIKPNQTVRLPTEVEWEYCAKAGTSTVYSFGDDPRGPDDEESHASVLAEYGWYSRNSKGKNPSVGELKPNPWGLYDFHGNFWELCGDEWTTTLSEVAAEPHRHYRKSTENLVSVAIRGGCFRDHYTMLRSSARTSSLTFQGANWIGFRCVISDADTK